MSQGQFQWATFTSGGAVALASAGAVIGAIAIAPVPATIRRLVGDVFVFPAAVGSDIVATGMWGFIVQDERAVTAGIGSVPLPITNGDQEWLITRGFTYTSLGSGVAVEQYHAHFDSRAMRKLKQTDRLIMVIQAEVGTAVEFSVQARALCSS